MPVSDVREAQDQIKAVVAKLKKSADDFEPVTLEPNEAMWAFRIITEGFPGLAPK
jgi:hypothetical protein